MQEISVLSVIVNKSSDIVRHIFVKSLASDKEKSVILINIPGFCDFHCLRKVLGDNFGAAYITFHSSIEKIGIDESTYDGDEITPMNGYRTAVVTFKNSSCLKALKKHIENKKILYLYGNGKPLTGMRRWERCYNDSILNIQSTKDGITKYIRVHDEKVEKEKEIAKATEGIPDEDGWIKVSRHGKKPFLPNADFVDKKITEKMKRKRAKTEIFPRTEKPRNDDL